MHNWQKIDIYQKATDHHNQIDPITFLMTLKYGKPQKNASFRDPYLYNARMHLKASEKVNMKSSCIGPYRF